MYFKLAVMAEIQIGSDGWQAIIASDFTVENIRRAAEGTAAWMLEKNYNKVIIGFDCRFGGKMFSRKVAKILAANHIEVIVSEDFVTSAMISHGVKVENADLGIYITAGTKPFFFSGYKLITEDGLPLEHNVEEYIPESSRTETRTLKEYKASGDIKVIDLEELYFQHAMSSFDFDAINGAGLRVVIDAFYGSAHRIWERFLPASLRLRCEYNPSFKEDVPDPLPSSLSLLVQVVSNTPYTSFGVALGGAAEKITICDENGKFVDLEMIKAKLPAMPGIKNDGIWLALRILQEIAHSSKKLSEF